MRTRLTIALFAALLLQGCGVTIPGTYVDQRPQLPPHLIDRVDGVYKGPIRTAVNQSPVCPTIPYGTIEVGDHTLYFAYTPTTLFIVPIQPDGTVASVLNEFDPEQKATLQGQLKDGYLRFTVKNAVCENSYAMRWVL